MGEHEKLILKLKSRITNFRYQDLKSLLTGFGYTENQKGKTSGSRVAFIHMDTKHILRLHKPHPGNQLKLYQIDLILNELKERGILK
ncbi:type II toxin-antitoxin system HicA family toxin [bacterium]|nr:type II toxin-antitoxin system HicA family toxin [bacterium]